MQIRLFGIAKEIVGNDSLTVGEELQTVSQLKEWMNNQYPAMKSLSSFAVAVDHEYADDNQPVSNNSEIAIIPPVSGG